jgi:hypothetical protein
VDDEGSLFTTSRPYDSNGLRGVLEFKRVANSYAFAGVVIPEGDHGLGMPNDVQVMPGTGDLLVRDGRTINQYSKGTLAFVHTFINAANGIGRAIFGPDGNVYACGDDRIDRYDGTTGQLIDAFVPSVPGPVDLTFGNDGQLYVLSNLDFDLQQVLRFNGQTGVLNGTFLNASLPFGQTNFMLTAPDIPEPGIFGACMVAMLAFGWGRFRRASPVWKPVWKPVSDVA